MIAPSIKKETCVPCNKSINIGQAILECEVCFTAIHTKCYKLANFVTVNGMWCCAPCSSGQMLRYNPFPTSSSNKSDKFYDDEGAYEEEIAQTVNILLKNCKGYSLAELNLATNQHKLQNSEPDKALSCSKTQLSSYFHNIDGNKTNFNSLLVDLKRIDHKFSVIALAETNIDSELSGLFQIPDYTSFYQCTLDGKEKGTGVALYVNNVFNAEVLEELGYCDPDIESLFVKFSLPSNPQTFITGVIYRPPSGDFNNFLDHFKDICSSLPETGVRILGDYNVDFLQMNGTNNICSQFEDCIFSNGFIPVISTPTHQRSNSRPSCIDNILTNDVDKSLITGTLTESSGDHSPVFEISNISLTVKNSAAKTVKLYEYSNKNLENLVTRLESDLANHSASNNFTNFTNLFGKAVDATCKLERPKITKRTPQHNPWIIESIIAAIERKHELKDAWVDSVNKATPLGDPILRKQFTDYRNVLTCVINSAKNSFNVNRVMECKNDRKKMWQIINELRGKTKKIIKPSFTIDNVKITNRRLISNEFNKYFNSIASKLNDSLLENPLSSSVFRTFEDFLAPETPQSIFMEECSENEIMEIISNFDNNKASDIPIRVIKRTSHVTAPVMAKYFNVLMMEGIFPEVLKVGKITPIFKKGSQEDLGNYRPVSTLPVFGKIFEKVIYTRLYNFALSKNIIDPNQFGFRKSHSTSHALNHSVKIISDNLKNKKHTLGIFIDLSKAFDTIDHKTLVAKLSRYGIRGNALKLISCYLASRTQYTDVLGEKSDSLIVQFGVPQGSVLGPLLFLLYINDISRASNLGTFILFADDTNIFIAGDSVKEVYAKGNELLRSVQEYMYVNKLHINMTKCCYIHFKPKAFTKHRADSDFEEDPKLFIGDSPIKSTSQTKFLGVTIDENLSWEAHISATRRKLNYATATLNRIRDSLPVHLRKDLYHTLFESHLTYCISVWGGAPASKIGCLWLAQKQCIRVLFGDKEAYLNKFMTAVSCRPYQSQLLGLEFYTQEHTKPLFKKHSIMGLNNLYVYHTFMEIFKVLKFHSPISIHSQLSISARKPTMLITPTPSDHFIYRSSVIWNTISSKLKITDFSAKINPIKNSLKKSLLQMQHSENVCTWTSADFDTSKLIINISK